MNRKAQGGRGYSALMGSSMHEERQQRAVVDDVTISSLIHLKKVFELHNVIYWLTTNDMVVIISEGSKASWNNPGSH